MTSPITHLNLRDFTNGGPAQKQAFVSSLMTGLKRYGFLTLSGHGVDPQLLRQSYDVSAAFFALPEAEKRRYAGALRGYTPFGTEHAKDHAAPDLKEFWQIGHDAGAGPVQPNVWPDRPAGFRETFETLFNRLFETGRQLLGGIALGLELEEDYFDTRIRNGTSLLRLLHYPPVPEGVDPACIRAAAHEDINLITLLVAAEGSGLELLDRDGNWLAVENAADHLVIDTGDIDGPPDQWRPVRHHASRGQSVRSQCQPLFHALLRATAHGCLARLSAVLPQCEATRAGHNSR